MLLLLGMLALAALDCFIVYCVLVPKEETEEA